MYFQGMYLKFVTMFDNSKYSNVLPVIFQNYSNIHVNDNQKTNDQITE